MTACKYSKIIYQLPSFISPRELYLTSLPSIKKLNHQKCQKAQFLNRISKIACALSRQFTKEKEIIILYFKKQNVRIKAI